MDTSTNSLETPYCLADLITDRAGLEGAGNISIDFDPHSEEIIVHAINVIRDGVVQDRLAADMFTTIRREDELQSGIVDGRLTSFAELADVRVGDVIEWEYTRVFRSLTWPGEFSQRMGFDWGVPVGFQRLRVLSPEDRTLSIRDNGVGIEPVTTTLNGLTVREWSRLSSPMVTGETAIAEDYTHWGYLSLSSLERWSEVVDWAMPIFEGEYPLPDRIEEELARIRLEFDTPEAQITAAIRFVQDEIRYVGIEIGAGGWVPRSPSEVVELGYGDCKDKSLLLVRMIRALGGEAHLVLAHMNRGFKLDEVAPSPSAFNHMIVRIGLNGEFYWLDPTSSHQGGVFPATEQPDYGFALPLLAGQEELVPFGVEAPEVPTMIVVERFDLENASSTGVSLEVETVYQGRGANGFRRRLASESRSGLQDSYLRYYRGHYSGIESVAELSVVDDRDTNRVVVVERYRQPAEDFLAEDSISDYTLRADGVLGVYSQIDMVDRRAPINLGALANLRHVHEIQNASMALSGIPDVNYRSGFAEFTTRSQGGSGWLTIEYELRSFERSVPLADAGQYAELIDELTDNANLYINLVNDGVVEESLLAWLVSPENESVLIALVILGLVVFYLVGAAISLRRDRKRPYVGELYPVRALKFVVMSVFTFGVYPLLWMWKNWRWIKAEDERELSPFVRTFFAPFYFIGLTDEINRRTEGRRVVPAIILGLFGVLYLIATIVQRIGDRLSEEMAATYPMYDGYLLLFGLFNTLWVLPAVLTVNVINREHRELLDWTSRFRWTDWVAIVFTGLFYALILLGLSDLGAD